MQIQADPPCILGGVNTHELVHGEAYEGKNVRDQKYEERKQRMLQGRGRGILGNQNNRKIVRFNGTTPTPQDDPFLQAPAQRPPPVINRPLSAQKIDFQSPAKGPPPAQFQSPQPQQAPDEPLRLTTQTFQDSQVAPQQIPLGGGGGLPTHLVQPPPDGQISQVNNFPTQPPGQAANFEQQNNVNVNPALTGLSIDFGNFNPAPSNEPTGFNAGNFPQGPQGGLNPLAQSQPNLQLSEIQQYLNDNDNQGQGGPPNPLGQSQLEPLPALNQPQVAQQPRYQDKPPSPSLPPLENPLGGASGVNEVRQELADNYKNEMQNQMRRDNAKNLKSRQSRKRVEDDDNNGGFIFDIIPEQKVNPELLENDRFKAKYSDNIRVDAPPKKPPTTIAKRQPPQPRQQSFQQPPPPRQQTIEPLPQPNASTNTYETPNFPSGGHSQSVRQLPPVQNFEHVRQEPKIDDYDAITERSKGKVTGALPVHNPKDEFVENEARKKGYAEILKDQMKEADRKKMSSKNQDRNADMQYLQDQYDFNPFGRGGGGAPLRDQFGNAITTIKPNMRGDMQRTHFIGDIHKPLKVGKKSAHYKSKNGKKGQTQEDFSDGEVSEADLIANAPNSNITGQTAAQLAADRNFRPDYIVPIEKEKVKPRHMPVQPGPAPAAPVEQAPPSVAYQIVQPQVDWAAWRNELFALLQWERWQREEEEKKRKLNWMSEEERYRIDREGVEQMHQRELEDRRGQFQEITEDNMNKLQDYWEHRHDEEMRKWEEMMAHPRYVQYLDNDNSVRLSKAFVDQLGNAMRLELDQIKGNMDNRDLDLLQQITNLKKQSAEQDRERLLTLNELDRVRGELEGQKQLDGIRHKNVYNTLLWDKLMDHKLKYPECVPKYRNLDWGVRHQKEKQFVKDLPAVPDGERHQMLEGVGIDTAKIYTDHLNMKNHELGSILDGVADKTRSNLDMMDRRLFRAQTDIGDKTYKQANNIHSKFGGLTMGEHQVNYKTHKY